ncbi:hypothetical protein BURK1_00876 [Burkholderiales bacterium]|nr:hypothetical protein BURK1_00876 [Burkholderiales bacterium]
MTATGIVYQRGNLPRKRWAMALAALFALAMGVPAAQAQDEDLPARVGRIADVGGDLYHAPEDRASDWTTIGLNYPVTTGDNLWVAEGGRAEIDVGAGQIRLAGETNVHVSRLDDLNVAFFVAQGSAVLRLRVLDAGEVARIDTPNTQIVVTRPGLYRVDVTADRQRTVLVVREGEATLPSYGGMQQVLPGQTAVAEGLDAARVDVSNGFATDGFDTWSADRDRRYSRSRSTAYVSRQMVGYADLDEYGRWETDQTYGAVWYPTLVDTGWAPYRDGYWTWVGAFGWTWVDHAPWGYAPFHYGRWVHNRGRWGWCPGTYVARPYWAPAMVGWIGGAGWGLSLSFGAPVYGWVPLAWGEPYRPSWRNCSNRCWTHYNRPYAARVDDHVRRNPPRDFVNYHKPGGITAVSGAAFASSRTVSRNMVPVDARQVSGAPVLATAPVIDRVRAERAPIVKPGSRNTPAPASAFVPSGRGGFATVKPGDGAGGAAIGRSGPSPSTTLAPGRTAAPASRTPSPGAPVMSAPGSSGAASAPVPRDARGAPSSAGQGIGAPGASYGAPGAKPSPSGSAAGGFPAARSVPVPRDASPVDRGAPQRYTAPVQRDSIQPYSSPSSRGAAPAQAPVQRYTPPPQAPVQRYTPPSAAPSSVGGASMAAPRAAPQPVAPPPQVVAPPVQRAAPPPPSGGSGRSQERERGGRNDDERGASQSRGGSEKPGQGR